jgi:hypothetical protein
VHAYRFTTKGKEMMPHADPEKPDVTVHSYDVRDAQPKQYHFIIKTSAPEGSERQSLWRRVLRQYVGRCLTVFEPSTAGEPAAEQWAESLDRRIEFLEQRVPLMRFPNHRFAYGVLSPLNVRGRTFVELGCSLVRPAAAARAADALALKRDWHVIVADHDQALRGMHEPEQSTKREAVRESSGV